MPITETRPQVANISIRKHPQYDESVRLWDFLLASYRGGLGMQGRAGMSEAQARSLKPAGYYAGLFRFKRESVDDYLVRVAQTPYRPYARKIIQAFGNYVTKNDPEREGVESMQDFIADCNLKGTPLTRATQNELILQASLGEINILIDMPMPDRPIFSRYDAQQARIRPYSITVMPQSIVDWSIGMDGKYEWVIIECRYINNSPYEERSETITERMFWDKIGWQRYRSISNDNGKFEDFKLDAEGEHPCGECPVIRVAAEDIDNTPLTPESWAYDLFDMNRAIYNLESIDLVNLYYQTFGQLIVPRTAMGTEEDIKIASVSEAMTESTDENGITRIIQPTGAEAAAIGNKINSLKIEMYNVAGLLHRSDSRAPETAESKAWDFQEVNQFLVALARTADWIEREKIRLAGLWQGKAVDAQITYPKDFAVEDLAATTAAILDLKQIGFSSETGRKAVVKKVFRSLLLPDINPALMIDIEREIDESKERNPLEGFDMGREPENEENIET